jgi:hypothetical protein
MYKLNVKETKYEDTFTLAVFKPRLDDEVD